MKKFGMFETRIFLTLLTVFAIAFSLTTVFNSEVRAAANIAPLVDSNTIGIVRVDLRQVNIPLIQAFIANEAKDVVSKFKLDDKTKEEWTMTAQGGITFGAAYVQPIFNTLQKEGKADELFVIVDKKAIDEHAYPFFVAIPIPESKPKEEIEILRKLLVQNKMPVAFPRHGFMLGMPEIPDFMSKDEIMSFVRQRLANPSSEKRLDLNAALTASSNLSSQSSSNSQSNPPMIQVVVGQVRMLEEYFKMQEIPEEMLDSLPAQFKESMETQKKTQNLLINELEFAALVIDIKTPDLKFMMKMKSESAAKDYIELSNKSMENQVKMLKQMQDGPMGAMMGPNEKKMLDGMAASMEEMGKLYQPTIKGTELVNTIDSEKYTKLKNAVVDMVGGLLIPAVGAARGAAQRMQCTNNIKQIQLAFHNYHDVKNEFPPAYTVDANGKPLHSWRVLILPYIEEQKLYDKIKLNEPWDSEYNKQFHNTMISIYTCPSGGKVGGTTDYSVVVGKETPFGTNGKGAKLGEITDGLSNTILIVHRATPVNWMCPDQEITFAEACKGIGKSEKGIGGAHEKGTNIGFCDGSVHFFSDTVDLKVLKAGLTKSGGEAVTMP